ncbi:glucose-1-phosphate adenylyltransferase family protein [Georgenia sp. AZ-5]|uniref:glucose-1-phosphate adenylyltransferase family protein n=1 Tax=Georgenia sp. AZ-5 TaxID=3367526 RepID=UPI003754DEB7
MAPTRTLLTVLAGGASRLETLTDSRAAGHLRVAGTHRLIDFPLSHARNSGISAVWVLEPAFPAALGEYLAGGRPWDLDRTSGGLMVLGGTLNGARRQPGGADLLWSQAAAIDAHEPDAVLVAPADCVYRLDYADVVATHLRSGAEVTVVTTRYDGDRSRHGVVVARDGRVLGYEHRPRRPRTDVVATGVFAFHPRALLAGLDQVHRERGAGRLGDLGDHLLPAMVEAGVAAEFRHGGFWRAVGSVDEYWQAHLDVLGRPPFSLDDPAWPILTHHARQAGARVHGGGVVEDSVLAPGVSVEGTVRRSFLGPGVHVGAGAVVEESVVLDDVRVGPGARVRRAVVDEGARVRGRALVGGDEDDAAVALVGARAVVHPRKRVPAGGRYPEA